MRIPIEMYSTCDLPGRVCPYIGLSVCPLTEFVLSIILIPFVVFQ